jgi:hypothetical protein
MVMGEQREQKSSLQVRKSYSANTGLPDVSEDRTLSVRRFETEPAKVRVGFGMTINLGNYESARVDTHVELPCYVEEIDDAFTAAWELAEDEIKKQVAGIRKGGK